jgi:hypothetical protein
VLAISLIISMQDYPDGSERLLDECSRGWTYRTQPRDRFPEAQARVQAQTARMVERSGALLSRSTLLKMEATDVEHPITGAEAVDPLRGEEPTGPGSLPVSVEP